MSGVVNVVVTCTKQKTREVAPRLQLRDVADATPRQRVSRWVNRIDRTAVETVSARDLYAGDHWAIARELGALSTPSRQILVWVVSAGHGLLALDEPIKPYAATFSSPHPDTVVRKCSREPRIDKLNWWNEIIAVPWPRIEPCSIEQLAKRYPDCPLILAASANYLNAVQDDLRNAHESLRDGNLLSIISAGTRKLQGLSKSLLPADARLQHFVGGVLRSLNVRLARLALERSRRRQPTHSSLSKCFAELLDAAPELTRYDRAPMSDSEVRSFVRNAINHQPDAAHTRLLRELRAQGKACEQKRFRSLFQEVKGVVHG